MNLLQNRINELNSGIINFVGNRVYVTGFYSAEMLNLHLRTNTQNFSSKGIYDKEDVDFYNVKSNALFVIQYEGKTIEKYQYIPLFKKQVEYKNKTGNVTITIRKNIFNNQYNLLSEQFSYGFESINELQEFIRNEFKYELEIPILEGIEKMDFIAIDFETANFKNYSACSLGMVFVKNLQIVDEKYFLINPPDNRFDSTNTDIHGIKAIDVLNSPTFKEVWEEISMYFNEDIYIVAHNAPFDINVLKNTLLYYNLKIPSFYYFDSIPFSTKACKDTGIGNSLVDRTKYFGISLSNAHNALDDARAVAHLVIKSMEINKTKNLDRYLNIFDVSVYNFIDFNHYEDFYSRKNKKKLFANKKIDNIEATTNIFDTEHPLFEKQIVFTGELQTMDRIDAAQAAANLGAIIKNGVTRQTSFLIVGQQDKKLVGEDGLSGKEKKAYSLIEKGLDIQILNEDQFIELIKLEVPEKNNVPIV